MQKYVDMAQELAAEIEATEQRLAHLKSALQGFKTLITGETEGRARSLGYSPRSGASGAVHDVEVVNTRVVSETEASPPAAGSAAPKPGRKSKIASTPKTTRR